VWRVSRWLRGHCSVRDTVWRNHGDVWPNDRSKCKENLLCCSGRILRLHRWVCYSVSLRLLLALCTASSCLNHCIVRLALAVWTYELQIKELKRMTAARLLGGTSSSANPLGGPISPNCAGWGNQSSQWLSTNRAARGARRRDAFYYRMEVLNYLHAQGNSFFQPHESRYVSNVTKFLSNVVCLDHLISIGCKRSSLAGHMLQSLYRNLA